MIARFLEADIEKSLVNYPVTAIIGARQVGKSTLAKKVVGQRQNSLYIDLEKPSDRALLSDAETYFYLHRDKLICLDEIQLAPELFPIIRSIVDDEKFSGKFLVLGSASPELLRQSSETLAGRIAYYYLHSFLWDEVKELVDMKVYQLKGGFPRSLLADTDGLAFEWLANFKTTFLERDLRTFGFNLPPATLHRLWIMLAHQNGQLLNRSQLARSLGVSETTIRKYIDILHKTFMLRVLEPYHANVKKRLVKMPKIFIRDTGILHSLLGIDSFESLFSHPVYGSSWEVTAMENIIATYKNWQPYFYRTTAGSEVDLLLVKAGKTIVFEFKTSNSPKLTKGFWLALEDLKAEEAYVIAPVREKFPMRNGVWAFPIEVFLAEKGT